MQNVEYYLKTPKYGFPSIIQYFPKTGLVKSFSTFSRSLAYEPKKPEEFDNKTGYFTSCKRISEKEAFKHAGYK